MVFEVVPLNPIRFTDIMPYDFKHAHPKCYWQKFEVADSTQLQILSEDPDITLTVHDFNTDEEIHSFAVSEIPSLIIGQPFLIYEVLINWSDIGEGRFYLKLENSEDTFYSAPIWVAPEHPNTLLFRYRNSENNFSVVFDTEIIFTIRVEGDIQNFTPRFDDEIYNDQKRNASKLSSIPFREFTLFIGAAQGLPDWMTDKINRVMSCDMIQIDGDWFEKMPDAEWEVIRQDDYPFAGLQINIMPTNNLYLQRLKFQTEDPDDDMANTVILRRSENRWNVSGTVTVSNIFKSRTVLIYLRILRRTAPFTFRVGITNGGAEIGEFEAIEQCGTYQVRYPFETVETVYVTGVGNDSDVSLIYEQLDEVGGGDGGVIPPNPETLGVGAVIMYEQPFAQFEADFDLISGLGKIGTPWQGWSICNGQNGTLPTGGKVVVGFQNGSTPYGSIGNTGGVEEYALMKTNLPDIILRIDVEPHQTATQDKGTGRFTGGAGNTEPFGMVPIYTERLGDGTPFSIMQPYIVFAYIKKIA